jgi:hypothetical protein
LAHRTPEKLYKKAACGSTEDLHQEVMHVTMPARDKGLGRF